MNRDEPEQTRTELLAEIEEYVDINRRMADLLARTAAALKGPPRPLMMHDWSDLPAVAARVCRERDEALAPTLVVYGAAARAEALAAGAPDWFKVTQWPRARVA
jgi:hypothetical protein